MKTIAIVLATAAITWLTSSFIHGLQTARDRLWMVSALKAPGRMALNEIQAEMNAGRYELAKAKLGAFIETWQNFSSGPDSPRGPGIGNIMLNLSNAETNVTIALPSPVKQP